ncbi:hypothetical protein, partial [Demequina sediminicola]|uniref:hypothetical protein n=1 Tax=Demequina sediminicola TaxID=1095026 RepID=UPI000A628D8E
KGRPDSGRPFSISGTIDIARVHVTPADEEYGTMADKPEESDESRRSDSQRNRSANTGRPPRNSSGGGSRDSRERTSGGRSGDRGAYSGGQRDSRTGGPSGSRGGYGSSRGSADRRESDRGYRGREGAAGGRSGGPRREGERPTSDRRDGQRTYGGSSRSTGSGGSRGSNGYSRGDSSRSGAPSRGGSSYGGPRREGERPGGDRRGGERSYGSQRGPARSGTGRPNGGPRNERGGSDRRDGYNNRGRSERDDRQGGGWKRDQVRRDDRRNEREDGSRRSDRTTTAKQVVDVPDIPEEISIGQLDRTVRARLRTLSKDNAEDVGRHLVMAGLYLELDPELAYKHAQVAVARAGRVDVVREAGAVAAYATGRYAEALREFRTVRRLNGSNEHLALMADCERGLGRPERAVALAREPEAAQLEPAAKAELDIVVAGARMDMGDGEAALLGLSRIDALDDNVQVQLDTARATVLRSLGRTDEAEAVEATLPAVAPVKDPWADDITLYDTAELDDPDEVSEVSEEPLKESDDQ